MTQTDDEDDENPEFRPSAEVLEVLRSAACRRFVRDFFVDRLVHEKGSDPAVAELLVEMIFETKH